MDNLEFSGKIKGMKTFKELQQERLLKATLIPDLFNDSLNAMPPSAMELLNLDSMMALESV